MCVAPVFAGLCNAHRRGSASAGDGRRIQTQPRADAHLGRRAGQTPEIAARFVVPQRQLQPERDWLGVNAVGAADLNRGFELEGAALERAGQTLERRGDRRRGPSDLQRLRGVDDVVGGEAVVKPARGLGGPAASSTYSSKSSVCRRGRAITSRVPSARRFNA